MDFVEPDWDAPLDVDAYLARIPDGETIKGMFVSGVVKVAAKAGHTLAGARDRYVGFQDYPLREQVGLLVEAARVLSPDRSLRQGLRRLGRGAAAVMHETTVGRVMLAAATDPLRAAETFAKGYSIVYAGSSMTVVDPTPGAIVLRAEKVYGFLDAHHVGVLEGTMGVLGIKPRIKVRMKTAIDGDLLCTYSVSPPAGPSSDRAPSTRR